MPTPPPPSRARRLQRRLVTAATSRLPVKLAALFFSLVLWFMVSAEEPTEEWVDARVMLSLDSTVSLRERVPRVQALVVGRGRELLKLYAAPPVIRRGVGANTPADVVLDLRPDDVILPSSVDARVSDVQPHSLPLHFRVMATRRVPVRALVSVDAGPGIIVTGMPRVDPESVSISGPRARVQAVTAVSTARQALAVNTPRFERTIAIDTAGLGVAVSPAEVRLRVPAMRDSIAPPTPDSAKGELADTAGDTLKDTLARPTVGGGADTGAARRARRDSAARDSARRDSARRDSARRDSARGDSARRDSARRDSARRDSGGGDTTARRAPRRPRSP
ncbi:MAG TPA: hypothetical protein VF041_07625 [Gemmatimonadaceae bacterium]